MTDKNPYYIRSYDKFCDDDTLDWLIQNNLRIVKFGKRFAIYNLCNRFYLTHFNYKPRIIKEVRRLYLANKWNDRYGHVGNEE